MQWRSFVGCQLKLPLAIHMTAVAGLLASAGAVAAATDADAESYFQEYVLPIFEQHCYECHSHRAGEAKGGLVLDSRSGWAKGGDSGPALTPGDASQSLLLSAVRRQDLEMPPGGKLPDELIAHLERWIADGAYDPRVTATVQSEAQIDIEGGRKHWAFQPLASASPPDVKHADWTRSEVDRFVLAKLEANDLLPVDDADRYTWLRRTSLDLTGLPPTVAEIREFSADESPYAYERVVDRLLASHAFGERWARHWLDLVGYADQIGTSNSVFAEHAWRYRNYVIDAFNNDKPFDQFVREQIAGDLLPYDSVAERTTHLVATGFLVLGDIEIVEADKEKLRVDIVDKQIQKVGKAMLGMTLDCARCHDHKFDPIPQRDYYALAGIFNSTSSVYLTGRGVWSDVNARELPETDAQMAERKACTAAHAARLAELKDQRKKATERLKQVDEALAKIQQAEETDATLSARAALKNVAQDLQKRLGQLNRQIVHAEFFAPTPPKTYGVRDVDDPGDMRITIRGNPRALGDAVPRGFLQVISSKPPVVPDDQSGRRELAEWVASRENPLTGRVAVNRIWHKLFGEGLVRTVDYFGLPGEKPSHPELLDYLAAQFIRDGWSQKRLIRSLVLSRTYGLSSSQERRAYQVDPDNRLLWRMNAFRLDAESLRDAMVFVAGELKPSIKASAIPLEFPENVNNLDPKDVNPPSFRLAKWRPGQEFERTIYLPIVRHGAQVGPAEILNVFDFPQPSEYVGKRAITAVPTQALFLVNSPVVKGHAAALASRIQQEADGNMERLDLLWLKVFGRPITEVEQQEATDFLAEADDKAWLELCHTLLASNEFLMRL